MRQIKNSQCKHETVLKFDRAWALATWQPVLLCNLIFQSKPTRGNRAKTLQKYRNIA
jgi:hypothetical protein